MGVPLHRDPAAGRVPQQLLGDAGVGTGVHEQARSAVVASDRALNRLPGSRSYTDMGHDATPLIACRGGSTPSDPLHVAASLIPAIVGSPGAVEIGRLVMIFVAAFLSGVVLYIIGSVMDRRERAERERRWKDRDGRSW
jgi:hypothetical protein